MALVEYAAEDGIATLTLNRPETLNALSPPLFEELRRHVDHLAAATETIGCVILRGRGRSFSSGNDLGAISRGERASTPHFQAETIDAIEQLPQPVIVAIQGHCYTGALELALGGDLMICAESAKLADTHGRWGMSPTWGMSQRLPKRIGLLKAKELMFSGRVVGAREAVAIGLANQAVADDELEDAARAMAVSFLENSWFTLRADKMLINAGANRGLADGLAFERDNSPGAGPDLAERLAAFGKQG